jgi:hypothetical protein
MLVTEPVKVVGNNNPNADQGCASEHGEADGSDMQQQAYHFLLTV